MHLKMPDFDTDNPTLFSAMFCPSIPVVAHRPSGSVLTTWAIITALIGVALVILSAVINLLSLSGLLYTRLKCKAMCQFQFLPIYNNI